MASYPACTAGRSRDVAVGSSGCWSAGIGAALQPEGTGTVPPPERLALGGAPLVVLLVGGPPVPDDRGAGVALLAGPDGDVFVSEGCPPVSSGAPETDPDGPTEVALGLLDTWVVTAGDSGDGVAVVRPHAESAISVTSAAAARLTGAAARRPAR